MINDKLFIEKDETKEKDGNDLNRIFEEKTGKKYSQILATYRPKLIWNLTKMCSDPLKAEDVADEAFIKAFLVIKDYNPQYHFSTWLFTIGKNLMLQVLTNDKKTQSIDYEYDGVSMSDNIVDTHEHITESQEYIQAKQVEMIKSAIYNLPKKYAQVMILRELDNLQYKEIEDYLGENLNTIKSRIKAGRSILKKQLTPIFKDLEWNMEV